MRAAAPTLENLDPAQLDALRATLLDALNSAIAGLMLVMAVLALAAAAMALFGLPGRIKKQAVPKLTRRQAEEQVEP